MGSSGYLGNLLKKFNVFRMLAEFVVADERRKRLAAKDAEFIFIDLLEHHALIEFGSALQVAQQFFLADVENGELEHGVGFALVHQVLDAAPARLQLLKSRMVKDFIQLQRDKMIDLGDARVDRGIGVARELHLAFEHLRHELLDHVPAAITRDLLFSKTPLLDYLI